MSDDDDPFDWTGDTVVVAQQSAIAVYTNGAGDIVIRQDGDWYRRDDAWVVVTQEHARRLCRAIMALAGQPEPATLALPAPAPKTPAERAKRYRENKRHAPVTPCDAERDGHRDGSDLFGGAQAD